MFKTPKKKLSFVLKLILVLSLAYSSALISSSVNAQEKFIRQIGEDYGQKAYYNALVIGIVNKDSSALYTFGQNKPGEPGKPTKDNYFEIGSLTKVFTATFFQDLVIQGVLDPETPVEHFLPDTIDLAQKDGAEVKLKHLATHTGGLPRVDEEYYYKRSKDIFQVSLNPYKNYDTVKLYRFLEEFTPFAKPGLKLHYSNIGMGLLGHILTLQTGKSYDSLVAEYTRKMGLSQTSTHLSESTRERYLLPAFNRRQQEVPYWEFDVLAPAGALYSTPKDMLHFLKLCLNKVETPLTPAIKKAQKVRDTGNLEQMKDVKVGYGWFKGPKKVGGEEAVWHNGQSGGFSSFLAFAPGQEKGVVALANTNGGLGKLAFEVLRILNKQ